MSEPTVVRYEPHGGARELLLSRATECLIVGPAGTGKSMAMLSKLFLTCLQVRNVRALLVRQTHASLTGTTLALFEETVAKEALASGLVTWFGGSGRQSAQYRFGGSGSTIVVGGLDRPEKFLSASLDRIAIDEGSEIDEKALETLISRLRGTAKTYKQVVVATNPAQPSHFLKLRADSGKMHMIYSRHRDNPAYFNRDGTATEAGADYMSKLNNLTGVRRARLLDGRWSAASGIVYESWDDSIHIVPRRQFGPEFVRIWAWDFGYVNPTAVTCFVVDGDGRMWLEWEHYRTQWTTDQHVTRILEHVSKPDPDWKPRTDGPVRAYEGRIWTAPRPRSIVCDHDAEGRALLERELGMSTISAHKAVKEGIEAVQSRLRPAGDGIPRLLVMRDTLLEKDPALVDAKKPTCLTDEILGYVWDEGAGKTPKDVPLKVDDHQMDGLRYACAELDLGVRPRVRWLG